MALRPAVIELLLNGQWTDITPDVYIGAGIDIRRGRSGEGNTVDPSSCSMTLNNRLGKYSPRNPVSPYYGQLGRNTPTRVSVAAGTPWLGLPDDLSPDVRISTPDAAALDITGDLDVRFDVALNDWSTGNVVELAGKWGASGNRSWYVIMFGGRVSLNWSANGAAQLAATSASIPASAGSRLCVRAVLDVDNGASGNTTTFYTAPSMSGPWTQLGSPSTASGITSIFNSTAALQIGDISTLGFTNSATKLFSAEIRNGIAGTVVANPDCTAQKVGTAGWTDAAGRAWTTSSALAITNRHVRFVGEVSEWPPRWDTSGNDIRVLITASGILRRLGKGTDPLASTLRRRLAALGPVAYWPMEDGDSSTQAASAIPGVLPMKLAGAAFAAVDGPPGSDKLPTLTQPATINATVPAPSGTPSSWHIEYVVQMDTVPVSLTTILQFTTTCSPWPLWTVQLSSTELVITGSSLDGNSTTTIADIGVGSFAGPSWARHQITATQSGGNVAVHWQWTSIGGGAGVFDSVISSATVGHVTKINTPLNLTSSIGHIAVFEPAQTSAFVSADTGFSGEAATTRLVRLSSEQAVPLILTDGTSDDGVMGPQRPGAYLDLLREAEAADIGILFEQREVIGLAYRCRNSLYNQTAVTINYAAKEVSPPLEPTDDDTNTLNRVTVSRPSGSSATAQQTTGPLSTAVPPAGVGPYPTSVELNVASDDLLLDLASWMVHTGTWDDYRFPALRVSLDSAPAAVDRVTSLDLGDRAQVVNPPAWLAQGPIDQLVQGYSEHIAETWDLVFVFGPAGPWTVGVLDDVVLGRCDTDGSSLAAGATSTATALSVATVAGAPLWVTTAANPAEFPFDVSIAGEQVTVTAVTGSSSPQSFTVTRSVNGVVKALPSNADVRLTQPLILAL
jgi:hypothetical protein